MVRKFGGEGIRWCGDRLGKSNGDFVGRGNGRAKVNPGVEVMSEGIVLGDKL